MKRLGYFAAVMGAIALTIWTITLGIELAERVHYLSERLHPAKVDVLTLTGRMTTAENSTIADESTDSVPVPKDHPPLKITCGAHTFTVVYASHDWLQRKKNPAWAMSQMDKELIVLDRQRSASDVREDVIHELIHISIWNGGGKWAGAPSEEEGYVKVAAPTLRDILADNPNLVKWLTKAGG